MNEVSRTLFELLGVEHHISSAYHPQTNGLDERTNQTLVQAVIKLTLTHQEHWDLYIDSASYSYQILRQDSFKYSPFILLYNCHPKKAINHKIASSTQDTLSSPADSEAEDNVMEKLLELREHHKARATTTIKKARRGKRNIMMPNMTAVM